MNTCPHGEPIGAQARVVEDLIRENGADDDAILEYYSACDCCDYLMHKDAPYQLTKDGRTLCSSCQEPEQEAGAHEVSETVGA